MSANRILVVEDNAALAENLVEILEGAGFSVRSASSIATAIEAGRNWVDVGLVDFKLPDGDGTELASRLKAISPDCEVILLTGFASVESAAAAVRSGAYAYLLKPATMPEVLLTVEQAMRQVRNHVEKRELARRAQVAEKLAAVGTLTAGLTHEIRNPLNAASLQLQVLERRIRKLNASTQTPLLEPLTLVRDEIRRLDHILQDFLQFARPVNVTAKVVALRPVIKRVTDLLATDAETRGLKLLLECAPSVSVMGDEMQLQQVFMNLALNALDASATGGTVMVTVEPMEPEVLVSVDDAGPGIEAAMRERIFEPFFTTKSSGSGLGLPITRAIVTQHGGTLTVETSPRGGARFIVRLPSAT